MGAVAYAVRVGEVRESRGVERTRSMHVPALGAQSELEVPPPPSFPPLFSLFGGLPMPPCLSDPCGSLSISSWVSLSVTLFLRLRLHRPVSLSGAHVKGHKPGLQEVPETLREMTEARQSAHPVVPSSTDMGEVPACTSPWE